MELGCPLASACVLCNNTAIQCAPKGVVYEASCEWCKSDGMENNRCEARKDLLKGPEDGGDIAIVTGKDRAHITSPGTEGKILNDFC